MASIKKRGAGWQVRVSYKDETGKFRTKNQGGFKTKREAQLFANEYEIKSDNGELTSKKPPLFADYFWEWFETYKESSVRDRTKATYTQAHHILEKYLPNMPIDQLDRRNYQLFIKKYGTTHSKSTVSKMNSLYHASVKDAVYDGLIKKDFIDGVKLVFDRSRTRKVEYLNEKELLKLVDYLITTRNPHFTSKYMILTGFFTGMRPGEIGGLRWPDINFNFKTFTLKQAWNETTKDFEPLKNESSYRVIRVDDELLNLIKELPRNDPKKRVFANQYQTIPTSSAVNTVLRKSMKETKIVRRGFHFHSCRHTHVAYLLSQGIDLYAISKRLGHSNVVITSRVYAYLIDEYKNRMDDKITVALTGLHIKQQSDKTAKKDVQ